MINNYSKNVNYSYTYKTDKFQTFHFKVVKKCIVIFIFHDDSYLKESLGFYHYYFLIEDSNINST